MTEGRGGEEGREGVVEGGKRGRGRGGRKEQGLGTWRGKRTRKSERNVEREWGKEGRREGGGLILSCFQSES